MALTEEAYQNQVITEVGDDAAGSLVTNVPLYWTRRASVTDLELRFLLVKRDALILMLGKLRDAVDRTSGSDTVRESQAFDHLLTLLGAVETQIAQYPASDGTLTAPRSTHVKHRIVW